MKKILMTGLLAIGLSVDLFAYYKFDENGIQYYDYIGETSSRHDSYNSKNWKKVKGNVGAKTIKEAVDTWLLAVSTQNKQMIYGILIPRFDPRRNVDVRAGQTDGYLSSFKYGRYDRYEVWFDENQKKFYYEFFNKDGVKQSAGYARVAKWYDGRYYIY